MNIFRKLTLSILLSSTAIFASDGGENRRVVEIDGVEITYDGKMDIDTKTGLIAALEAHTDFLLKSGKYSAADAVKKVLGWIKSGQNPNLWTMMSALSVHLSDAEVVSSTGKKVLDRFKEAGIIVGNSFEAIKNGLTSTGQAGLMALKRLLKKASELRS